MTSTASSYYAATDDEFSLTKFIVYSGALHAIAALAIAASIYFQYRGNEWGGVGGSSGGDVKVNLVSSAGIPMPTPPEVTESQTVDPTQGLFKEEAPKPPEPPTEATKVPEFKKEKPLPPSHKSKTFESHTPPPDNAVPYGKGGTPSLPTGYGTAPGSAAAGVTMQGPGGGDFATRYGWYVAAVVRKIQSNWQQNTIDPNIRAIHRAKSTVQFTILRDGTVKNLRIYQGSGNLSMDNSGLRAVLSSGSMPPLPNDYNSSEVTVIFDFDLSLNK
jgi:TonB family protein